MLAKNVNGNACILDKCGACEFFASKLAPTEGGGGFKCLDLAGNQPCTHQTMPTRNEANPFTRDHKRYRTFVIKCFIGYKFNFETL